MYYPTADTRSIELNRDDLQKIEQPSALKMSGGGGGLIEDYRQIIDIKTIWHVRSISWAKQVLQICGQNRDAHATSPGNIQVYVFHVSHTEASIQEGVITQAATQILLTDTPIIICIV